MRLLKLTFLLILGMSAAGRSHGGNASLQKKPQLTEAAKLLLKGRYSAVIAMTRTALRRQPSATAMRALQGIALSRSGRLAEALPHLSASAGVMAYIELGGFGAHADALRASGQGHSAWSVRSQRLSTELSARARVQTLCQGVDDLLSVGDTDGAIGLGEAAVVELPDSPAAHAFLATALIADGRLDDAGFHHWRSRTSSHRRLARVLVNEAWLAETQSDFIAGLRAWEKLRVMRRSDVRIVAWQAGWLRRVGLEDEVPGIIDAPAWRAHQSPDLYAERVLSHIYLGRVEEAEQALTRLASLFPDHPRTRKLLSGTED